MIKQHVCRGGRRPIRFLHGGREVIAPVSDVVQQIASWAVIKFYCRGTEKGEGGASHQFGETGCPISSVFFAHNIGNLQSSLSV